MEGTFAEEAGFSLFEQPASLDSTTSAVPPTVAENRLPASGQDETKSRRAAPMSAESRVPTRGWLSERPEDGGAACDSSVRKHVEYPNARGPLQAPRALKQEHSDAPDASLRVGRHVAIVASSRRESRRRGSLRLCRLLREALAGC